MEAGFRRLVRGHACRPRLQYEGVPPEYSIRREGDEESLVLAKNSLRPDYARSEIQSIDDEVGFLGDKSADDGPHDPEKEYRHLIMLRNRCRTVS